MKMENTTIENTTVENVEAPATKKVKTVKIPVNFAKLEKYAAQAERLKQLVAFRESLEQDKLSFEIVLTKTITSEDGTVTTVKEVVDMATLNPKLSEALAKKSRVAFRPVRRLMLAWLKKESKTLSVSLRRVK